MAIIFPNNNLPTASQPWGREVTKQLSSIIDASTSQQINNIARDTQLNSSIIALTAVVNGVSAATTLAQEAADAAQEAADTAQAAADAAQDAADDALAAQITANSAYSYADVAYTGLNGLSSSSSTFTVNADNLVAGAITASSVNLTSSGYFLKVGTVSEVAYLRVDANAPNSMGVNEVGFAAAADNNQSGWVSNFFPRYAGSLQLGVSGKRWSEIFCINPVINTSDKRLKTDIQNSQLGLNFINSLRPVSYKWIKGNSEVLRDKDNEIVRDENGQAIIIDSPGVRPHYGFIAQEVREVIENSGIDDFAGLIQEDKLDPESLMSLRYTEFISPMVKAIQELSAKVEALENK